MNIVVHPTAKVNLSAGARFYEQQGVGLGEYFEETVFNELDSLRYYAGVHPRVYGLHRMLIRRFPFAIYYAMRLDEVAVLAILDCRRKPSWTASRVNQAVKRIRPRQ